jgi:zinc transport system substrate-binding protein
MARTLRGGLIPGSVLALAVVGGQPAGADEIEVVASIKPVHSLVAGVMQGVGEPVLLVKGASSPHSYQLRPSEARALDQARVVFWIGEGLETFLVKPLAALSSDAAIVALSEATGVELLAAREGGMWQAHEHAGDEHADAPHPEDRGHGDEHADQARAQDQEHLGESQAAGREEDEEHAPGRFDLHLWLDPHNAQAMVGAIVAALSAADPDNAAAYESNGDRLRGELQDLDASIGTRLQPVRDRPFVVFHDAYHYFEDRYRLNALGSISVDPGRRPGARRLGEIRERLEELDAACVFAEPQFEPTLVDTVIEGTGARKGVLDPLGADLDAGPDQYFRLIDRLANSLLDCLGAAKAG